MRSIVFIQRQLRSLATAGALTLVVALPCPLVAQTGKSQPASATPADPFAIPPGVKRVPVSKAVFGDAGTIVNARDDGFIEIAAAGPKKTVLLQLRTVAARGWLDSTLRMIKARVKKADPPRSYRSDIRDYATGATMALTRAVDAGQSQFALAFAEDAQSQFTVPIEPEEADVFLAIVRKAVTQAEKLLEKTDTTAAKADSIEKADSVAKADSIAKAKAARRKRPAAKPAASPPAVKDSTSKAPAPKPPVAKPPAKP
jgi:hypothetical protein